MNETTSTFSTGTLQAWLRLPKAVQLVAATVAAIAICGLGGRGDQHAIRRCCHRQGSWQPDDDFDVDAGPERAGGEPGTFHGGAAGGGVDSDVLSEPFAVRFAAPSRACSVQRDEARR